MVIHGRPSGRQLSSADRTWTLVGELPTACTANRSPVAVAKSIRSDTGLPITCRAVQGSGQ